MSRINTNVSSLLAQNTLGRANESLQTSLTRLSTGLRINSGADDPAGLIASVNLRRDITAINKAISNNPAYIQLQALDALKAISADPASKVYFLDGDSPSPLPLMHLGEDK